MEKGWETKAAAKRSSTMARIQAAWKLSSHDLQRAKTQRDLTGPFVKQLLAEDDISIISKDSVDLVECLRHGSFTAVEVTTAFCKTAAVAHQIVG